MQPREWITPAPKQPVVKPKTSQNIISTMASACLASSELICLPLKVHTWLEPGFPVLGSTAASAGSAWLALGSFSFASSNEGVTKSADGSRPLPRLAPAAALRKNSCLSASCAVMRLSGSNWSSCKCDHDVGFNCKPARVGPTKHKRFVQMA